MIFLEIPRSISKLSLPVFSLNIPSSNASSFQCDCLIFYKSSSTKETKTLEEITCFCRTSPQSKSPSFTVQTDKLFLEKTTNYKTTIIIAGIYCTSTMFMVQNNGFIPFPVSILVITSSIALTQ